MPFLSLAYPLILASKSKPRSSILKSAGFQFVQKAASIDEEKIKKNNSTLSSQNLAIKIASEKGALISKENPNYLVIAADQLCVLGDTIFSKPGNKDTARHQLSQLSGKTHELVNGIVVYHNQKCIWKKAVTSIMSMRALTENEINAYIEIDKPLVEFVKINSKELIATQHW